MLCIGCAISKERYESYNTASQLDFTTASAFYAQSDDPVLKYHYQYWCALSSDIYDQNMVSAIEADKAFIPGFQSLYASMYIIKLWIDKKKLKKILTHDALQGVAQASDAVQFRYMDRYDLISLLSKNNSAIIFDSIGLKDNTLLHKAVHKGKVEVIAKYLACAAKADIIDKIDTQNAIGNTALHGTIAKRNQNNETKKIVQLLLDAKASVTIQMMTAKALTIWLSIKNILI